MRLVYGEAGYLALVEQHQRLRAQQRLGGQVEQLDLPSAHALGRGLIGAVVQRAVQKDGRHVEEAQGVHLILHERNQRRHDNRQSVQQQRRQLIAERLAAARGQNGQCVPALEADWR